jgi:hypothetical protein
MILAAIAGSEAGALGATGGGGANAAPEDAAVVGRGGSTLPGSVGKVAGLPESLASEPGTFLKVLLVNGDSIGDATRVTVATTGVPWSPPWVVTNPLVAGSGDLVTAGIAVAAVIARIMGMMG